MAISEGITGFGGSPSATADVYVICSMGTPTNGNVLVAQVSLQDTTVDVSSFNDDCGISSWSRQSDVSVAGLRQQMWVSSAVTGGTKAFVKANFTGATLATATLSEWSGVAALGLVQS